MSAKIKSADIRKEYEELEKDKLLDEVVDLVLENDKLKRKLRKYENHHLLLQRCWAHLIREVKKICKNVKELDLAYMWICDMFGEIQRLRKIKSKKIRQRGYDKLIAEMEQWCQIYFVYAGMKEIVNKVKNGKEFWFTCVLHPEVEPTNNQAERGLRKFVVIEKIIGCLRSEQGKKNMQVMLSVFQTWRLQGLNPYKELRAIV